MVLPSALRAVIPLVAGLTVGLVGATLFLQSMPGSEGSPEERATKLEMELKRAQNRILALQAAKSAEGGGRAAAILRDGKQTLADGARQIAEDMREGRPVSPEDIFRASQPLMRDLAPLFDRMRMKTLQQMTDSMTGELARKYNLSPERQVALKEWFRQKSEDQAKQWSEMVAKEGTRLEDVMRATQSVRVDEGLDSFMPGILAPEQLATFNSERMAQRAQRVQQEADMKVQRLDAAVGLDEAQRDQVFAIMARSSRDYTPAMVLEGAAGQIGASPAGDRQAAIMSVLRPDQRAAYQAERQRRREEAAKEMETVGLALPANWEIFDDDLIR